MENFDPLSDDEVTVFTIEPDTPEGYDNTRLEKIVGSKTLREFLTESYDREKVGWVVLATGSIAVTAAGIKHYYKNYPEDVE